jgi:cobalamin biosynthesis protein CobT
MSKTWKELAEELKSLAEVILEQAKHAFSEGDLERGLMLTKEFRSAIKTAGDLNMIAQGVGELEEDFEEEDIEKALGLEDEEDLEEEEEEDEEEDESEEEEESEEDYDEYTDEEGKTEANYDFADEERKKIKYQVGDSIITLEQILQGIARKKT